MRVLLADDHALFRAGIASLLRVWGIEVVGEASDGLEALEQARRLRPDLVLMDINMPRCNGLEATRLIKTEMPDVKIVIVTVSDEDDDLFEAIKSGAQGYLLKNMSEEEFSRTLTSIGTGEAPFSRGVAARILDEFARLGRDPRRRVSGQDLTERERGVLQLVVGGSTNRESGEPYVTGTVNFRLKNILSSPPEEPRRHRLRDPHWPRESAQPQH
jgi:DNA-binding NarL/FixJ family response regulator